MDLIKEIDLSIFQKYYGEENKSDLVEPNIKFDFILLNSSLPIPFIKQFLSMKSLLI